jgi:DNA polymerase-3 subunit delta
MSVTTLSGSNHFLIDEEIIKRQQAFLADNDEIGIEHIDAENMSFNDVVAQLNAGSLFINKKFIILKNIGLNKELAQNAADVIERLSEDIELVIVEPKIDQRSKLYKDLKQLTHLVVFNELDQNNLIDWVIKRVGLFNGTINRQNAALLIETVGINQLLLSNEIDKLLLYDLEISKASICLLCEPNPQSSIFDLMDAIFSGNLRRVNSLYMEQKAIGVDINQIIGLLTWQLHIFSIVKSAPNNLSIYEIAKAASTSPGVISKAQKIVAKISVSKLDEMINRLLSVDHDRKTKTINEDDALLHYLLSLN